LKNPLISPRSTLAALSLSAAALVGLVLHEGYSDRAIIPVQGDVPTVGFGSTTLADGTPVKMGDTTTPPQALARAFGEELTYLQGSSAHDIVTAGVEAMQAEAQRLMGNPSVCQAYEQFLLVCELSRKTDV